MAGSGHDGLPHKALFIQTIAQTLGADFRVIAQTCQQVIRAHELLEFGEDRGRPSTRVTVFAAANAYRKCSPRKRCVLCIEALMLLGSEKSC